MSSVMNNSSENMQSLSDASKEHSHHSARSLVNDLTESEQFRDILPESSGGVLGSDESKTNTTYDARTIHDISASDGVVEEFCKIEEQALMSSYSVKNIYSAKTQISPTNVETNDVVVYASMKPMITKFPVWHVKTLHQLCVLHKINGVRIHICLL